MNKLQVDREKRKVLNLIKYSSLSGNKCNYFTCYMSENRNHIELKFKTWLKLRELNYDCWVEPIFKSGIRMDILAFSLDGKFKDIEILSSETDKQLAEKIKNYPNIEIIGIKNINDLDYLE